MGAGDPGSNPGIPTFSKNFINIPNQKTKMSRTKKVGSTGRFGVRYGIKVRQRVLDVERRQKQKHKCPYCHKLKVKRVAAGIYLCKKCNSKFTGKAYWP